jgi:hypothetical protein
MPDTENSIRPLHHLVDGTSRTQRTLHRRPKLPNPYDPLGLFGDGPPTWIINKGKLGQRPSFSADEAMKERDATVFKLRWHANLVALLTEHAAASTDAIRLGRAVRGSRLSKLLLTEMNSDDDKPTLQEGARLIRAFTTIRRPDVRDGVIRFFETLAEAAESQPPTRSH